MDDNAADHILVMDLRARCVLGVKPDERREKQEVLINLDIETDTRKAAASDRFADALDYRALKKEVLAFTEKSGYRLVEALAGAIAGLCLARPAARRVTVTVEKPSALRFARSVAVRITRARP